MKGGFLSAPGGVVVPHECQMLAVAAAVCLIDDDGSVVDGDCEVFENRVIVFGPVGAEGDKGCSG